MVSPHSRYRRTQRGVFSAVVMRRLSPVRHGIERTCDDGQRGFLQAASPFALFHFRFHLAKAKCRVMGEEKGVGIAPARTEVG